jgi:hypothetical protein
MRDALPFCEPEAGLGLPGPLRAARFMAPEPAKSKRRVNPPLAIVAGIVHFLCMWEQAATRDAMARRTIISLGPTTLPLKRLGSIGTVVRTLGGTNEVARSLGISSSHVSNWRKRGRIPAKYYLVIRELLAEQGFEPATRVFNFEKRVRQKRRPVYCDFDGNNVIYADFRRRKVRLAA